MEPNFDKLVEHLQLRESDRLALKQQRGFTDEVIDKMKFRSCGEHLLHDAHICQLPPEIVQALGQKNILIPFFNAEGRITSVRPHKFGIKGQSLDLYIPYPYLGTDLTTIVIAESEFKALASCLMGVPAIGIPGIASFSRAKFNLIPDTLAALGTKNAVICFDNEVKGDEKYDNYKADFTKRYDTEFYAYIMATLLQSAKFETRIATLKDEWRENGKIDIDGVLARGIDPEEYRKVIAHGKTAYQLRMEWSKLPPSHLSFLERRVDRFFYSGYIEERFNCYYAKTKDQEKPRKLSNFTIEVLQTIFDQDAKAERLAKFKSAYGGSQAVKFQPDVMVSKMMFQKFCLEMGDYQFSGNDQDLAAIWHYIFINQSGKIVIKVKQYGYHEEHKMWYFGNGAYYEDRFYKADRDGIVWIKDIGFLLPKHMDNVDIPQLAIEEVQLKLSDVLAKFGVVVGENEAKFMLGWTLGNYFMPEILETWGIYPFYFLHGKQAGGKSTIANWISSFFGLEVRGISFHGSSVAGLSRITNQMSMIPMWFEEYRNGDPHIGTKNNFLRGIYDRSMIVKGTKKEDEIKTYRGRSSLIISGEEHPRDAALMSRCYLMPVFRGDGTKESLAAYQWLQDNRGNFSEFGHYILTNKKTLWPKIKERVEGYRDSFSDQVTISDRNKNQVSIIAGICDVLVGDSETFSLFVGEAAVNQEGKVNRDQALNVFFEDIKQLVANGRMKTDVAKIEESSNVKYFYLWFAYCFGEWEVYFRGLRSDLPASKAALIEHLKKEPYFVDYIQTRLNGRSCYCMKLDYNHPGFPEHLKDLMELQHVTSIYRTAASANENLFPREQ